MKLLLRRDQKSGMLGMGKVAFTLDVRAEISEEDKQHIQKYKLGDTALYEKNKVIDQGSGLLGAGWRLANRMLNLTITVDDLSKGKRVEVKDIVEMIAVEEQIKDACHTFKAVLNAAKTFGGEEVIEIA
jgi:hypothetical protein